VKVIDVFPKDIFVSIEFSSQEIRGILNFLEKSMSLYAKVHSDGLTEHSDSVINELEIELKRILKMIEAENKK
jgi:hypothetical protein